MKKKNAILLADTRIALVGQMLVQINNTNKGLFDEAIIFYDDEINEKDKKLMNSIIPCNFIKFDTEIFDSCVNNEKYKRFTKLSFARYEMFNLLSSYENILWLDTDIVIQGSLKPLLNKAMNTGMAMLCEDEDNKSATQTDINKTNFNVPLIEYDMDTPLYCSGIIAVNDKLKNCNELTSWCYGKTKELFENLNLPDQGILNLMIQEFELDVTPIGDHGKYGAMPYYGRDCSKSAVIHSWGKNKFWNSVYLSKKYPRWSDAYNQWVKMGGSSLNFNIEPDASVVIPVYKPNLNYFKILLDSLVSQKMSDYEDYQNFEIIIVAEPQDDNKLVNFIKKYNDPRIVLIINKERLGIAASINIGIRKASSNLIARVDDDDICNEYRIYKQVQYLKNHPDINMCTSDYSYFGDMNEYRITFEGDMSYAWSLFTCPFDHPTIMFRKDFFVGNDLFYDEKRKFVEDWELWMRAFNKGMRVGCIHEELYKHRWHNGQAGQSNKTVEMMRELVKINFEKLGIKLSQEDLLIVAPWQGKIDESKLKRLKGIYNNALKNNKKLKIYNQRCLSKVFELRYFEAENGYMKDIVVKNGEVVKPAYNNGIPVQTSAKKRNIIKRVIVKLFKPFYYAYKNRMAQIVHDNTLEIDKKILNTYIKVEEVSNGVSDNLNNMKADFNGKLLDIDLSISKINNKIKSLEKNMEKDSAAIQDKIYDFNKEYNVLNSYLMTNLKLEKKVFLIGTAEHANIGDSAICVGELLFIRKYYSQYKLIEISTYEFDDKFAFMSNIIGDDDLILLHGGGNIGDRYLREENVRRKVISSFPQNKIVILPQTIFFENNDSGNKELELSSNIYNSHRDLTIFTRGLYSKSVADSNFKNSKILSTLDLALMINKDYNFERDGILACIRDFDDESGLTKDEHEMIFNVIKKHDAHYCKTKNVYSGNIYMDMRGYVVNQELEKFAKRKVIVTDRLHGMIFAIITRTPCVVINNYNYKLEEFYNQIKESNAIIFIGNDLDKLDDAINQALIIKKPTYPNINKIIEKIYNTIDWK